MPNLNRDGVGIDIQNSSKCFSQSGFHKLVDVIKLNLRAILVHKSLTEYFCRFSRRLRIFPCVVDRTWAPFAVKLSLAVKYHQHYHLHHVRYSKKLKRFTARKYYEMWVFIQERII